MLRASTASTSLKALLAAAAVLGLAACQKPKEEYKTDVKDESGGQLIVEDATPNPVDVKIPDTPMTNVPPEQDTDQPSGD